MNLKQNVIHFWRDEQGIGTLEMIMIVAVIVVIAFAFRKWIFNWVDGLFADADSKMAEFKSEDSISLP